MMIDIRPNHLSERDLGIGCDTPRRLFHFRHASTRPWSADNSFTVGHVHRCSYAGGTR